jgi:hypothetical protein
MSCNCKNPKIVENNSTTEKNVGTKLKKYFLNTIFYLIVLAISSILIIPVFVVVLFRVIVLKNNEINLLPGMVKMFGQNKKSKTDGMFDGVDLLNNVESK